MGLLLGSLAALTGLYCFMIFAMLLRSDLDVFRLGRCGSAWFCKRVCIGAFRLCGCTFMSFGTFVLGVCVGVGWLRCCDVRFDCCVLFDLACRGAWFGFACDFNLFVMLCFNFCVIFGLTPDAGDLVWVYLRFWMVVTLCFCCCLG